ncbi:MAG: DsbA family protein [Aestuariivirga sp.]
MEQIIKTQNDKAKLIYLMDPLCGWCYGASGRIQQLAKSQDYSIELLPVGLFSGSGARNMDQNFAAYAWSNDQRIAKLTDQEFSEAYQHRVLDRPNGIFDSSAATLALTAVFLTSPASEVDALKIIQQARYVRGLDITDITSLIEILNTAGFVAATDRLKNPDQALINANQARMTKGQHLMRVVHARGVPTLVVINDGESHALATGDLLGSYENLTSTIKKTLSDFKSNTQKGERL